MKKTISILIMLSLAIMLVQPAQSQYLSSREYFIIESITNSTLLFLQKLKSKKNVLKAFRESVCEATVIASLHQAGVALVEKEWRAALLGQLLYSKGDQFWQLARRGKIDTKALLTDWQVNYFFLNLKTVNHQPQLRFDPYPLASASTIVCHKYFTKRLAFKWKRSMLIGKPLLKNWRYPQTLVNRSGVGY